MPLALAYNHGLWRWRDSDHCHSLRRCGCRKNREQRNARRDRVRVWSRAHVADHGKLYSEGLPNLYRYLFCAQACGVKCEWR